MLHKIKIEHFVLLHVLIKNGLPIYWSPYSNFKYVFTILFKLTCLRWVEKNANRNKNKFKPGSFGFSAAFWIALVGFLYFSAFFK